MGEKIDVTQESFVSSTGEVKAELAADVAAETEGTGGDDGLAEGDPSGSPEGEETAQETMNLPTSYVTRDPDKISPTFTRNLPVPVPDDELAEHAKEMARLHHLWVDTKLKQKAFAKSCKGITDKAEEDMVALGAIIQEGLEERPVSCHWEFDYAAGVKKLRRLDNWQIVDEETLQGDELHLSFDFQKQSEENVAKFFEGRESQDSICDACNEPITEDQEDVGHECNLHKECAEEGASFLTGEELNAANSELAETGAEDPGTVPEPKEKSSHACKVCGFNTDNHVYLVRHLRDVHALKLSEYKAQYPANK